MKFKNFINETKELYVVLTRVSGGLTEVAYTDHPDKNAGFSKGTIEISKLENIWPKPKHIVFDEPILVTPEIKNKIDALLFASAQNDVAKSK